MDDIFFLNLTLLIVDTQKISQLIEFLKIPFISILIPPSKIKQPTINTFYLLQNYLVAFLMYPELISMIKTLIN